MGAKEKGGETFGISPATNLEEHVKGYGFPVENFDMLIFTGAGKRGAMSRLSEAAMQLLSSQEESAL